MSEIQPLAFVPRKGEWVAMHTMNGSEIWHVYFEDGRWYGVDGIVYFEDNAEMFKFLAGWSNPSDETMALIELDDERTGTERPASTLLTPVVRA